MRTLGLNEAQRAAAANTTPRLIELGLLRSYAHGKQYEGRPKWTDKSVPVWDREPCVIWQAVEGASQSNEDLLLADGRYPVVTTRPNEDEEEESEGEALDEDSSDVLDKQIQHIEKEAKLRAHTREAYTDAQYVGTCVGLFGSKNGRLFAATIPAEQATPEYNEKDELVKLTIQYPYIDLTKTADGLWKYEAKIFRRVIDATRDVTYLPELADPNGVEPNWREDKAATFAHNLGFCPVIWHKFRVVSSIKNCIDGRAIHCSTLDELDAYNLQASIRHDGAIYSLPQKWETGVEPGYNPTTQVTPQLIVYGSAAGGQYDPSAPPREKFTARSNVPQGARKQGPGEVWQYDNAEAKVGQLELNAGALEALANTMADLRARISETLAWVALNPEEIKFAAALSGKAIERLMARQLNRVAKDRDGFGNEYMVKAYAMLLRIAAKLGPTQLKTRGLAESYSTLQTFENQTDGWSDPPISLQWGEWFQATPEDNKHTVDMTKIAYDSSFITKRTVVEKLRRIFGIENVEAYLEALEKEKLEKQEEALAQQEQELTTMHKVGMTLNGKPGTAAGNQGASRAGGNSGFDGVSKPKGPTSGNDKNK